MGMIVKGGGSFEPAPPGPSSAICIDVVDLGTVDTAFGAKTRLRIVWSLEKKMKTGKPFIVQKTYNRSLHPKSTLRVDLESWLGRAIPEAAINKGIDLEKFLGRGAFLAITHNVRDAATYANVTAIMPLPEGMPCPIADPSYVRHCDRDKKPGTNSGTRHGSPSGEDWMNGSDSEPPVPEDSEAPPPDDDELGGVF